MDEKAIFKICKDEGCCDACCLRYLGLKHPRTYENVKESVKKYSNDSTEDPEANGAALGKHAEEGDGSNGASSSKPEEAGDRSNVAPSSEGNGFNGVAEDSGDQGPAAKRRRGAPCATCLGLLQESTWPDSCRMAKDMLDKKRYDVSGFACALSAPLATLLREKYMQLTLKQTHPDYSTGAITSLKEAWKWTFGVALSRHVGLSLDSGAVAPLLVTLHYEYPDEAQELEILKSISPSTFAPHKRPAVDVTRRAAEQLLERASRDQLRPAAVERPARCVAVAAARAPLYVAGRYIKLSRALPQTPWLVRGRRMMESSVQEVICKPIADLYELSPSESEHRLKFVAAGREDVDVRCLGTGRPFAVEISDPRRSLSVAELARACEDINTSGSVRVLHMTHVTKEDLTELKKGEETKSKDYEALCIKLEHSHLDEVSDPSAPVTVTAADIERINTYRNTPAPDPATSATPATPATPAVRIVQRTPLRVLHRRPLLARDKHILAMHAAPVPGHPSLLVLRLRAGAGLYVKEFVHGELGRSRPALHAALAARADLLALDVTHVSLPWPPPPPPPPGPHPHPQ